MVDRMKKALIDSFVGAIAVAWLFAEGIMSLVASFTAPLSNWLIERMRWQQSPAFSRAFENQPPFPFAMAIPQLIAAVLFLVVAYLLFRWLFLAPCEKERLEGTEKQAK